MIVIEKLAFGHFSVNQSQSIPVMYWYKYNKERQYISSMAAEIIAAVKQCCSKMPLPHFFPNKTTLTPLVFW